MAYVEFSPPHNMRVAMGQGFQEIEFRKTSSEFGFGGPVGFGGLGGFEEEFDVDTCVTELVNFLHAHFNDISPFHVLKINGFAGHHSEIFDVFTATPNIAAGIHQIIFIDCPQMVCQLNPFPQITSMEFHSRIAGIEGTEEQLNLINNVKTSVSGYPDVFGLKNVHSLHLKLIDEQVLYWYNAIPMHARDLSVTLEVVEELLGYVSIFDMLLQRSPAHFEQLTVDQRMMVPFHRIVGRFLEDLKVPIDNLTLRLVPGITNDTPSMRLPLYCVERRAVIDVGDVYNTRLELVSAPCHSATPVTDRDRRRAPLFSLDLNCPLPRNDVMTKELIDGIHTERLSISDLNHGAGWTFISLFHSNQWKGDLQSIDFHNRMVSDAVHMDLVLFCIEQDNLRVWGQRDTDPRPVALFGREMIAWNAAFDNGNGDPAFIREMNAFVGDKWLNVLPEKIRHHMLQAQIQGRTFDGLKFRMFKIGKFVEWYRDHLAYQMNWIARFLDEAQVSGSGVSIVPEFPREPQLLESLERLFDMEENAEAVVAKFGQSHAVGASAFLSHSNYPIKQLFDDLSGVFGVSKPASGAQFLIF